MRNRLKTLSILTAVFIFFLFIFDLVGCDSKKSQAGRRVYVTIAGDNEVIEIDEKNEEITAHIPVGKGPAVIVASPDGSKLYTANWGDNSVSVITPKNRKVASLKMPGRPYVIAMSPKGKRLYVGLNSKEIAVIDLNSNSIVKTFPTSENPAALFVSPDEKTLYVAVIDSVPGNIRAISADTGKIIHEAIEVGIAPTWLAMSPDGSKIYALNYYSDDISVVDIANWMVEATISTGKGSKSIMGSVSSDNSTLYVTNLGSAKLVAIDTQTNKISRKIPINGRPIGVNMNKKGNRIYVTDCGPESLESEPSSTFRETGKYTSKYNGQISIYQTETGDLLSNISVGPGPISVVVLPFSPQKASRSVQAKK